MAKVRLSFRARLDILLVLEHLSDVASSRTARKYDTDFKRAIRRLARFPGMGSPRPHFGPEARMVSVDP